MRILKFVMFNRFVKMYLQSNFSLLEWNKRFKSLILEMWNIPVIFFPILIISMIPKISFGNPNQASFVWTDIIFSISFSLMMVAIINKDFFGGQSAVHRFLGFKVVDVKTNEQASKLKCMLRNVTAPIWMIEVIFLLVNPKRRLGDIIAGTSLIEIESTDPELILIEIQNAKFDKEAKLTLLISIVWVIVFILLFDQRIRL
ncbi:RDD family protein [Flavobacterium aestuarii]|uniref:RDD family protein n=1 Tax=Flavobacterium aestuarii TaxID=3149227 RepID=UPI0032B3FA51